MNSGKIKHHDVCFKKRISDGWVAGQRGRHGGQPSRGQGAAQGTAQSFCTPGSWCFKEPLLIRAWNTIADPQKQRGNVVSLFTWKNEIQMFFSHDALNYTFACKGTFPNCECFRPNSCKISFMFLFFCVCVLKWFILVKLMWDFTISRCINELLWKASPTLPQVFFISTASEGNWLIAISLTGGTRARLVLNKFCRLCLI